MTFITRSPCSSSKIFQSVFGTWPTPTPYVLLTRQIRPQSAFANASVIARALTVPSHFGVSVPGIKMKWVGFFFFFSPFWITNPLKATFCLMMNKREENLFFSNRYMTILVQVRTDRLSPPGKPSVLAHTVLFERFIPLSLCCIIQWVFFLKHLLHAGIVL